MTTMTHTRKKASNGNSKKQKIKKNFLNLIKICLQEKKTYSRHYTEYWNIKPFPLEMENKMTMSL